MTFDPAEALRRAGLVEGVAPAQLQQFVQSLTKEETDVLIALKNRLGANADNGEVVAHSEGWAAPQVVNQQLAAAMDCFCGAWSGSGSTKPSV